MTKLRVGVLFGGRSGEHEVSLVSAASVIHALDRSKYDVIPIGITKEGKWISSNHVIQYLSEGTQPNEVIEAMLLPDPSVAGIRLHDSKAAHVEHLDVIFPVLHGTFGEDGTIQGLLELANIPYVGAGVLGSALGMDKSAQKEIFKANNLPIVPSYSFRAKEFLGSPESVVSRVVGEIGFPCFVKPPNLGSSVGISKAEDERELFYAIEDALEYDRKVLIEKAVRHPREFECAVLGNDEAIASVVGEVIPSNEFYDYDAKYVDGKSATIIPADLPQEIANRVRAYSLTAFHAIDCEGMARVDFLLERGTENLFISELNTIPGFTSISMYPKLFEASGIPYPELLDRLISLALERHEEKRKLKTTYQPKVDWHKTTPDRDKG